MFCAGDCTDDGSVTIDEIVTTVGIGLESVDMCLCVRADIDKDGRVSIDEILTAVNNALDECGASIPSPTATPLQPTSSPTASAAPTARPTMLGIGDLGFAEVTVRVADASSHDPIKGATVSFQRFSLIGNSPGPFAGSGITDSQGSIQFHMFIHDTDGFTFAAQAEGFKSGEIVVGGGSSLGGVELWFSDRVVDIELLAN